MSDHFVEPRDIEVLRAIAEYGPTSLKAMHEDEAVALDMAYTRLRKAGRRLRNAGYAEWLTENPWTIVVTDGGRAKLSEDEHSTELIDEPRIGDAGD